MTTLGQRKASTTFALVQTTRGSLLTIENTMAAMSAIAYRAPRGRHNRASDRRAERLAESACHIRKANKRTSGTMIATRPDVPRGIV